MARVTVVVAISLPPEMVVELDALCKKEHRTRSELVREALRQYAHNDKETDSTANYSLPHDANMCRSDAD
jgi:metal-responsive CopG/Arc/MetJ family transcriptional regulator